MKRIFSIPPLLNTFMDLGREFVDGCWNPCLCTIDRFVVMVCNLDAMRVYQKERQPAAWHGGEDNEIFPLQPNRASARCRKSIRQPNSHRPWIIDLVVGNSLSLSLSLKKGAMSVMSSSKNSICKSIRHLVFAFLRSSSPCNLPAI